MTKFLRICVSWLILGLILGFPAANYSFAQTRSMASKHVVLQFPAEREIMGRELSSEAERCYDYMNRAMDGGLPRTINITLDWNASANTWNFRTGRVTIGMNHPDALADAKKFLNHALPLGIARLGLLNLSQGGQREDTEFLFDGMAEILVHEYSHSTRSLDVAWATARLLDETGLLGFSQQRDWSEFSKGVRNHRNAAPGITFLMIQRELDRIRPMKFFTTLRKNSLLNALNTTFKVSAAELESIWLKRVREYEVPEEITVKSGEGPHLSAVNVIADEDRTVRLHLLINDPTNDVYPENVFVRDMRSGKTFSAENLPVSATSEDVTATREISDYSFTVTLPVAPDDHAGQYDCKIIIIDEAGNLRQSTQSYTLK